jgi:hypothetical protein
LGKETERGHQKEKSTYMKGDERKEEKSEKGNAYRNEVQQTDCKYTVDGRRGLG